MSMGRIKYSLLSVIFVMGVLLSSCSSDNDTTPVPIPIPDDDNQDRTELSEQLEDDIQKVNNNLSFNGIAMMSDITSQLLLKMGRSRNFMVNLKQLITMMVLKNAVEKAQPVTPGSELEKMGFKAYIPIDISSYGVRVAFSERGDYDITPAQGLEFVFPATVEPIGTTAFKFKFRNSGSWHESVYPAKIRNMEGLACINRIPTAMTMTVSALLGTEEVTLYEGVVNINIDKSADSEYVSFIDNNFSLNGQMKSLLQGHDLPEDDGCLGFSYGLEQDGKMQLSFDFNQNGLKLVDFSATSILPEDNKFVSMMSEMFLNPSESQDESLMLRLARIFTDADADFTLDLLDNLHFVGIIGDVSEYLKALQKVLDNRTGSQVTADEFKSFVETLNQQWSVVLNNARLSAPLLVQMAAEQQNDGFSLQPAFQFGEETDFVPLSQLVSQETLGNYNLLISEGFSQVGKASGAYMELISKVMQMMPVNINE